MEKDFFSILELLHREIEELKQQVHIIKENTMKEEMDKYNKILSNYIPIKDKPKVDTIIVNNIEYILDNNVLFNDLGEIVGKIDKNNNDEVCLI